MVMNMKAESLLEDYRQADFTRRLHLFLEYSDLREEFMQIDQEASAPAQHAVEPSDVPKPRRVCTWPRFLLLPGFQKRYCR
jgi:hypothetical protein